MYKFCVEGVMAYVSLSSNKMKREREIESERERVRKYPKRNGHGKLTVTRLSTFHIHCKHFTIASEYDGKYDIILKIEHSRAFSDYGAKEESTTNII